MNIIKRILQDKISERIEPNKAVLLFGARRVGKTVLIRELIKEFKGQSMLLNGEDYDTIALLNERSISNYRHLLEGIDLLAIDEAQNIPEIGSKLKLIVDEVEGIKVIASGSSSFDLLNKAFGRQIYPIPSDSILTKRDFTNRKCFGNKTALRI